MNTKKIYKRVLAVMLSLAMMIPGIYLGESDKQEVKAAESVSTDMLNVKLQVAEDRADAIRFISSVDSLDYSSVGFEIVTPSGTIPYETYTVYERIVSSVTNEEYAFSPKLIDSTSEYFFTGMYAATSGVEYTVRAFVTTLDAPTEKVYGPSRSVSLGDDANNTINMMVDFATAENATYDVYNGEAKVGTAKVIADKNVRITLDGQTATGFKSATVFTFKNGETNVGTTVYRNYYTKYTGTNTEDTSWYDVDKSAKKFVIASSADLYGLASLVNNNKDLFAGDTITQVRNIEVNKGTAGASAWSPNPGENEYEWERIGTPTYMFCGTYDGDDNTISGLVDKTSTDSSGLFGTVQYGALISNLKISNSNFSFTVAQSAAIAGTCRGSLNSIYLDSTVYIKSTADKVGGLIGLYLNNASQSNTIENCWVACTVDGKAYAGGLVGWAYRGKLTIKNCLFTGTINNVGRVGGFVAQPEGESGNFKMELIIQDSISAGNIATSESYAAGSVIGMGTVNAAITIRNVYTNENVTCTNGYKGTGTTGIGHFNNLTSNGIPMKFTDNLNGTNAYINSELDFWSTNNEDGVWLVINEAAPALRVGKSVNLAIQTLSGKRSAMGWYYNAHTVSSNKAQLPTVTTFELDCAADLNGFTEYCTSKKDGFGGDTIKLTADINLNEGWIPNVDANGKLTNSEGVNQWKPIGDQTNANFMGIFDGQGHTISGMYVKTTSRDAGLFGFTNGNAQIKNLQLTNSYVDAEGYSWVGGIVGFFQGTLLENLYVDDSVTVYGKDIVGGIAGTISATANTVSKCWSAASVYSKDASEARAGGIVGWIRNNAVSQISDCLFTGTVTANCTSSAYSGGLIGDSAVAGVTVKDCLVVGNIYVSNKNKADAVCGANYADDTFTNVYTTNEISCTTDATATFAVSVGTLVSRDSIEEDAKTALPNLYDADNETNKVWDVDANGMPILYINQ